MITSLRLVDFKNFADETLRMGPFTVIVGANASGKSNIRDALRFLHGIGRGYALADIVGGKYGVGGQLDWRPIRGATNEIVRFLQGGFSLEIGLRVSAYSASDGTLRFLAILAALLDEKPAPLYVFEEIDNGIHPLRLRLLLELIERQTARNNVQVVTTTHSPELLSMVGDRTFENTSVICHLPDSDNAIVRPIAEFPNAIELRRSQSLGRLHASGWFEDAAYFTGQDD